MSRLASLSSSRRAASALLVAAAALLLAAAPLTPAVAAKAPAPLPVKVMIVTLFGPEAAPWLAHLPLARSVRVPGLSAEYPEVKCTADGVCLMTTGMGHANAAASTMALALSPQFDLTHAWFVVTGIAGIDPDVGTLGAAAWARYLVDFGLQQEFDAREAPAGWDTGYVGIGAADPATRPKLEYGTEVFQLDEALLQRALALSRGARLEDNATYEALRRGAAAGRLDLHRVAVLRTGANFDRPHPGQTAQESLNAQSGGFPISTANLYQAAWPLVSDIVTRWPQWRQGVPAQ